MSKKSFFRQSHYIVRRFLPSNRFQKLRKVVFWNICFRREIGFHKRKSACRSFGNTNSASAFYNMSCDLPFADLVFFQEEGEDQHDDDQHQAEHVAVAGSCEKPSASVAPVLIDSRQVAMDVPIAPNTCCMALRMVEPQLRHLIEPAVSGLRHRACRPSSWDTLCTIHK